MEFSSSFDQANFMEYCPPSQYDSSHYSNDGWKYHQEMTYYEQSTQWGYTPEPQNDQANHMRYCPEPQNDLYHYPHCQNQRDFNASYSIHQETSSLDCAFNKFMQDCSQRPQNDPYFDESNNYSSCGWEDQNQRALNVSYSIDQEPSSLEQTFNSFLQNYPTSPHNFSFENSSSLDYASTENSFQNSQLIQTSLNQRLSKLESMLKRYEEETKKS
ncbi:hypothetical protein AHAS_Ahas04G0103200 [Arachis hypogaea]